MRAAAGLAVTVAAALAAAGCVTSAATRRAAPAARLAAAVRAGLTRRPFALGGRLTFSLFRIRSTLESIKSAGTAGTDWRETHAIGSSGLAGPRARKGRTDRGYQGSVALVPH